MIMTTLDLRHPVIAAGLAAHGMDAAELNAIVLRDGVSFDFGDKAGRTGLPIVHVGPDRCWAGWNGASPAIFRLSSPTWLRRGEARPLQQIAMPSTELPPSVTITLPGRPLSELVAVPGGEAMTIVHAVQGIEGLVVTLEAFYRIDAEEE